MNNKNFLAVAVGLICFCYTAIAEPIALWQFEEIDGGVTTESIGSFDGRIGGEPSIVKGAVGKALGLNGKFDYVIIDDDDVLDFASDDFSITAWANTYSLLRDQQMIIGKNVYSQGKRQWGLMLDSNNRFRFYMWDSGWKTITAQTVPQPGKWYHIAVTVAGGEGKIYINGKLEGHSDMPKTNIRTDAPITIGGIRDGRNNLRQMFYGALDEIAIYNRVLQQKEIKTMSDITTKDHDLPDPPKQIKIWEGNGLPKTLEAEVLENVDFSVIKPYEFEKDGYRFLHGIALAWHKGRLYASFGHNQYAENLAGEEARGRYSEDGGRTWSEIFTIESGDIDEPSGVSHGVFLTHNDRLWAFHGAYGRSISDNCHTRAYLLDDDSGKWEPKGVVVGGGFFPLQEPQRMDDGNWIMGGARIGDGHPAAVAISNGDDFTDWDLVVIPKAPGRMWGESSVIIEGKRIINIARYHGESQTVALVAFSDDYGRTWTQSKPSNMNMVASKPYTGTLSTGQHYLVCTTTADSGNARRPLTIAVTRPGEDVFSKVFVIRHAEFADGPGESHPRASLSYPYAIEKDGKLYVGYSNDGGGVGRIGEGRELWNNNSAEMAVIPISELKVD